MWVLAWVAMQQAACNYGPPRAPGCVLAPGAAVRLAPLAQAPEAAHAAALHLRLQPQPLPPPATCRPDGGCVALDTEDLLPAQQLPEDAPVLILLPGLTGGSEDEYVQHTVVRAAL